MPRLTSCPICGRLYDLTRTHTCPKGTLERLDRENNRAYNLDPGQEEQPLLGDLIEQGTRMKNGLAHLPPSSEKYFLKSSFENLDLPRSS